MTDNLQTGNPVFLTVTTVVNAPLQKTWTYWTTPEHITRWNFATDEWHSPKAVNDLREGGSFAYRMEAKDGTMGFDFSGTYTVVTAPTYMEYVLGDGRTVTVTFTEKESQTEVVETFEAESVNSVELQQQGWQMILDNFKKYTENN